MNAIAELLIRNKAIEFGDFTLASGAKSPYYVDVKTAVTHPELLAAIAQEIAERYDLMSWPGLLSEGFLWQSPLRLLHKNPLPSSGLRRKTMARRTRSSGMSKEKISSLSRMSPHREDRHCMALPCCGIAGGRADRVVTVVDREQGAAATLKATGHRSLCSGQGQRDSLNGFSEA